MFLVLVTFSEADRANGAIARSAARTSVTISRSGSKTRCAAFPPIFKYRDLKSAGAAEAKAPNPKMDWSRVPCAAAAARWSTSRRFCRSAGRARSAEGVARSSAVRAKSAKAKATSTTNASSRSTFQPASTTARNCGSPRKDNPESTAARPAICTLCSRSPSIRFSSATRMISIAWCRSM